MSVITKQVAKDILKGLNKHEGEAPVHFIYCTCSQCVESLRVVAEEVISSLTKFKGYHRPVCVKCETELRPHVNGVGLLDHAEWGPINLYDADLWKCPTCGYEVVLSFGDNPMSRHFDRDFQKDIKRYRETSRLVNNK